MNEIKHYVLPEHTNTLYKEEARSSIALTKDVAEKINELVDAYNQFSKIDLEWKHEQEGKIRGGILYMKDNLINTLYELLEILEGRGFFETNIKKYTKTLEKQLNNLLSSVSTDGELIDIRVGADGEVYPTAGESVRTQVENIYSQIIDLKELLFKGTFTFTLDSLINRSIGEDDGILGVSSNIRVTTENLIPFPVGCDVSLVGNVYKASVFCYDRNGHYIGYTNVTDKVIVLDGTYYVRFRFRKEDNLEISTSEVFNNVTVHYSFNRYLSNTENLITVTESKNKVNLDKCSQGYIHNALGVLATSSTSYYTTDFIRVYAGRPVVCSPRIRKFLFFDNTKTPDQSSYVDEFVDNYVFTPVEDGYIRVSFENDNYKDIQIEEGEIPTIYTPFRVSVQEGIHLSDTMLQDLAITDFELLNGKVICNFGDSIMAGDGNNGKGVARIIAEKYNASLIDYASGGATVTLRSSVEGRKNIITQVNESITKGDKPNVILFNGLTNDIINTIQPLGSIKEGFDDNFTTDNFTSCFELIVYNLKNNFPDADIIYVRPHNMGSRDYNLQKTYGERAKEICKKWSIPVVDVFEEGRLNTNIPSMTKYTNNTDKTHPTQEGYEKFYIPLVMGKIKETM